MHPSTTRDQEAQVMGSAEGEKGLEYGSLQLIVARGRSWVQLAGWRPIHNVLLDQA